MYPSKYHVLSVGPYTLVDRKRKLRVTKKQKKPLRKSKRSNRVGFTYLRAWNAIPPEKPERLFSFLACICRNLSFNRLDWQKAAKRKAEVVSLSEELEQCIPDAMAETHFQSQYLRNLLNTFLASLPEVDRLIFLRRYWYGEPVSQIAKQMHMGESKAKVRLFRIRGKLRDVLSKEGIAV